MPKYSVALTRTLSTTLPIGSITADASAPRRMKVFRLLFGVSGAPADTALRLTLQRCTAAGTSTAVTPQLIDPADTVAAVNDAGENHTVDATRTAGALPLDTGLHTRAPFQLFLGPGYEIVTPATASNGLALMTLTAGTLVAANATIHYEE